MRFIKENYLFFILIISLFIADRLVKNEILDLLKNIDYLFINDYLNLNLVFNTGIGFGILSLNAGVYYNILTVVIFLVILFLLFIMIKLSTKEKIYFSLIIGGAIGNLYDRIFFKAVPDFIDFHVGNFHWFVFNVADIFISIGVLCLVLIELFYKNYEIK